MIRVIESADLNVEAFLSRSDGRNAEIDRIVTDIIADVRANGDEALLRYTRKFDCPDIENLIVGQSEIDAAYARCGADFIQTLEQAAENIGAFHAMQARTGFAMTDRQGVVLGQRFTPIARAGIYVPGGTASYPSTVLMDAIPAKIAGVSEIVMTTPPDGSGNIFDGVLAAAKIAGVSTVVKAGGAQAVAALAYGTNSVPKVDKIVGPGNVFVATAKRFVFGQVGIDMIAGPSEILIIADGASNPRHVAADMLSQAEHDKMASAVLLTDDWALAGAVRAELNRQVELLPRKDICRVSIGENSLIVIVKDMKEAADISNRIAPEHLELCVQDPFALLPAVQNAGSIFLGRYAPEALGDYFAGPNHTLPTGGTARFSSPLSVDDFVKKSSYIYYNREALLSVADKIADFAQREGLAAHAYSIAARFEEDAQ